MTPSADLDSSAVPDPPDFPADTRDASTWFQRRRPLFWGALAWMAGIALDDALQLRENQIVPAALVLGFAAVGGLRLLRTPRVSLCMFALFMFAGGSLAHALGARILPRDHVDNLTTRTPSTYEFQGTVVECARTRNGGARWLLEVETIEVRAEETINAQGLVQLFVANAPTKVLEGSRVRVTAEIGPPRDTFPDDFHLTAYLQRKGIHRTGRVTAVHAVLPDSWNPVLSLRRFSHGLSERAQRVLPPLQLEGRGVESQGALLSALLFGRREQLDRADRDAFAATGTAHLLAISGLQLQFLAWLFWKMLRRTPLSHRRCALLLFIATWAYTALSGSEAPIVRAAVMISFFIVSQWIWRESDSLSLLGAAAILILAFDPGQLFLAGFQLSFAAVFALVALVPLFNDALRRRDNDALALIETRERGLRERVGDLALISFAAWLGTAPIIAWHMKQFSLLSVPANLLAVPLSSMAMVAGLGAIALDFVSTTLAAPLGWAAFALLALLQTIADFSARVPFCVLRVDAPATPVLLGYALVLLALWRLRASARLRWLAASASVLLIGGIVWGAQSPAKNASLSVTLLDLPGRAVAVIRNGDEAVLVNTGGESSGALLAAWLDRSGVRRVRAVIAMESETSALGGIATLAARMPVERVLLPRDDTPHLTRRALEAELRRKNIPWSDAVASLPVNSVAGFSIEARDDGASHEAALMVRIACGETSLLLVDARSAASLDRLMREPDAFLRVNTLALGGHASGQWPKNTAAFVLRAKAPRVLDLSDQKHMDLWHESQFSRGNLYIRAGSLRMEPDGSDWRVEQYREGRWVRVK